MLRSATFRDSIIINEVDADGNTALHHATINGCFKVWHLLLCHKANTNIANKSGEFPLTLACARGDMQLVEALLLAGSSPDLCTGAGHPALAVAVNNGNLPLVTMLL